MEAATVEPRYVSQAQYARMRAVSRQAVFNLVKRGKLQLVGGKIDVAQADEMLQQQLDPSRAKTLTLAASTTPVDPEAQSSSVGAGSTKHDASSAGERRVVPLSDYQAARTAREQAEAETAQLKLALMRGDALDRASTQRAIMAVGRTLRDALMPMAQRIGPGLVGKDTNAIVRRLEDETRKALEAAIAKLQQLKTEPEDGG